MILAIYKSDKSKLKKILTIYLFFLCILAFFYIPSKTADLYRYIISAKYYNSISPSNLNNLIVNSSSPMQIIYFYLIGRLHIDGLIPAITAFIYYGCYFRIVYGCTKKYDISNKSVALSLLLIMAMGGFLSVISIVRAFVAFSIIALSIYREIIENKSPFSNIILYLFAAMMHLSAIVMVVIRFMLLFFSKEKKISRKIINILFVLALSILILKYGSSYFDSMRDKADYYTGHTVYSYIWEYLISFIYMILSTFILILFNRNKSGYFEIDKLIKYNLIINLIILCFSFEYSIFTRFQMFSGILFTPVFAFYLDYLSKNNKKSILLTYVYIIAVIAMFLLACTRGNLCGYKFLLFS